MAGDWMKVEHATPDKPEILAMASAMNVSPDEVFGICFRMWRWFDQHTKEGNALSVTTALLNRYLGVSDFAEQALAVGWLEVREIDGKQSICLPNFERHNGQTSKQRALTAKRVANHKGKGNAKGNAPSVTSSVTEALPREEKRREEKRINTPPKSPKGDWASDEDFVAFWYAYPKQRRQGPKDAYPRWQAAVDLITKRNGGEPEPAKRFLQAKCEAYAASPVGQTEFAVGPAVWLNQGRYDDDPAAWQRNQTNGKDYGPLEYRE